MNESRQKEKYRTSNRMSYELLKALHLHGSLRISQLTLHANMSHYEVGNRITNLISCGQVVRNGTWVGNTEIVKYHISEKGIESLNKFDEYIKFLEGMNLEL